METNLKSLEKIRPEIYYLDPNPKGSPVVLLLHGLGADSSSWGYQIPILSEANMRPICVDLPGFGKSPIMERNWKISKITGQVADLTKGLTSSCIVVGISMGGTVALQLCLDYPELVERLVLVSTFATLKPKHLHEWIYLSSRYIKARLQGVNAQAEMVAKRIFPNPNQNSLRGILVDQIHQANPTAYVSAMRALRFFDVRKRLNEISVPTLVISGGNDTTVPLENQTEMTNKIHGARQIIIPGGGHAIIADQPDIFNQVLLDFLSDGKPGSLSSNS